MQDSGIPALTPRNLHKRPHEFPVSIFRHLKRYLRGNSLDFQYLCVAFLRSSSLTSLGIYHPSSIREFSEAKKYINLSFFLKFLAFLQIILSLAGSTSFLAFPGIDFDWEIWLRRQYPGHR